MIAPKYAPTARQKRESPEFTPDVRDLVAARSELRCEGCGSRGPLQFHHRLFKSRLGRGNAANGLALCGMGNVSGCHGKAHSGYMGESLGWAVRTGGDPLLVPVFRSSDASWWRFDDLGGKHQIPAGDALEYLTLIGAVRVGLDDFYDSSRKG